MLRATLRSFCVSPSPSPLPSPSSKFKHDVLFSEKSYWVNATFLYHFTLPEDYDMDHTAHIFKEGYHRLKTHFPYISKQAVTDADHHQTGMMSLQDREDTSKEFVIKDMRDTFPMHCHELKQRRFPLTHLDDSLSSHPQYPVVDEESGGVRDTHVSSIQLNFIRGGVLLTLTGHHWFLDGVSKTTWLRVWAEECCRVQGIEVEEPFTDFEAVMKDRDRVAQDYHKSNLPAPLEPLGGIQAPRGGPPKNAAVLFSLSEESLAQLKIDTHPSQALHPVNGVPFTSTFDAVAALIWYAVTISCRTVYSTEEWGNEGHCLIAMDIRRHFDPPLDPRTLGCFVLDKDARAPVSEMAERQLNLADLASRIRKTNREMDRLHVENHAASIEHKEDLTNMGILSREPFQFSISNWLALPWTTFDWGPVIGKADCVRTLNNGFVRNFGTILNHGPDGKAIEVAISIDAEALEPLKQDPVLRKYATLLE